MTHYTQFLLCVFFEDIITRTFAYSGPPVSCWLGFNFLKVMQVMFRLKGPANKSANMLHFEEIQILFTRDQGGCAHMFNKKVINLRYFIHTKQILCGELICLSQKTSYLYRVTLWICVLKTTGFKSKSCTLTRHF